MAVVAACVASAWIGAAQEASPTGTQLTLGTWTGTGRVTGPNVRNPMPAPHNLVVQRVEDPHWRWRGGPKEMLMISVRGRGAGAAGGAQGAIDVGRIDYRGDTLSYIYTRPTGEVTCNLARKEGARFEGACSGSGFNAQVVLNEPAPQPSTTATGMAKGFVLGLWTGTRMTPEGTNPLPSSLLLSTPPGNPDAVSGAFTLPAGTFDARSLRLEGDTISFDYGAGAGSCKFARLPDGKLDGTCTNPGGAQLIVTLTPPTPAPRP